MEKRRILILGSDEKGVALPVVLVAMLILLPLAVILAAMVLSWQKQSAEFRDLLGMEFAARAGFEEAIIRLHSERSVQELGVGESTRFLTDDLGGFPVHSKINREADVVLTLGGGVLEELEAERVDLESRGVDPDKRRVRQYRLLKVYLVEVLVSARPTSAGVRLRGVLVKVDDERQLHRAGLVIDRGFFE
jgi:hypothetical protein